MRISPRQRKGIRIQNASEYTRTQAARSRAHFDGNEMIKKFHYTTSTLLGHLCIRNVCECELLTKASKPGDDEFHIIDVWLSAILAFGCVFVSAI